MTASEVDWYTSILPAHLVAVNKIAGGGPATAIRKVRRRQGGHESGAGGQEASAAAYRNGAARAKCP